jgi:hypothetical protein
MRTLCERVQRPRRYCNFDNGGVSANSQCILVVPQILRVGNRFTNKKTI